MTWRFKSERTTAIAQIDPDGQQYTGSNIAVINDYVYVACSNNNWVELQRYDYWRDSTFVDWEDGAIYFDPSYQPTLLQISTRMFDYQANEYANPIKDSSGSTDTTPLIAASDNIIYVIRGGKMHSFDAITCQHIASLAVPPVAAMDAVYANGKIFCVDQYLLNVYNVATNTWTATMLPGRPQNTVRKVTYGYDGFIWITSHNSHSIIKVDVFTNAIVATIRVNRHTRNLYANQSKELFVASDVGGSVDRKYYDPSLGNSFVKTAGGGAIANAITTFKPVTTFDTTDGMITSVNQQANTQTNIAGGSGELGIFDDGTGYLVFVTPTQIGRLKKSTLEHRTTFTKVDSSTTEVPTAEMIPDNGTIDDIHKPAGVLDAAAISLPISTDYWDGSTVTTRVVSPFLFVVDKSVVGWTLRAYELNTMYRVNQYTVRGTAMIAQAVGEYYGD